MLEVCVRISENIRVSVRIGVGTVQGSAGIYIVCRDAYYITGDDSQMEVTIEKFLDRMLRLLCFLTMIFVGVVSMLK